MELCLCRHGSRERSMLSGQRTACGGSSGTHVSESGCSPGKELEGRYVMSQDFHAMGGDAAIVVADLDGAMTNRGRPTSLREAWPEFIRRHSYPPSPPLHHHPVALLFTVSRLKLSRIIWAAALGRWRKVPLFLKTEVLSAANIQVWFQA